LEILSHRLVDKDTADRFAVEVLPLPPERLAEEPDALSGCLVRVTFRSGSSGESGLPLGPFRQTIELTTNLKASPTISIPVVGRIGKDFTVYGAGWRGGVLTIGTVSRREGARRQLFLIARGPHHKEVTFAAAPPVPDLLRVEVGETTELASGRASRTPIVIEVPKDSRPVNYLGSDDGELGLVTIRPDRPEVPDIKIRVRFAVQGD
jgi:hypothetical protein